MDDLDLLLLDAWNRVSKMVREDRLLALKRSRRRFMRVLNQPLRDCCLVIRASDTRISKDFGALVDDEAVEAHEPDEVVLGGGLIRRLTKPIDIPWPGVTIEEAARICGRPYHTMHSWVRRGVFRVDRYREHRFPRLKRDADAMTGEHGCRDGRPYVWTPSPIDSNNFTGRTPHAIWGTLWQWMWQSMPESHELVVRRLPRMRFQHGRLGFHGWVFECPGRLDDRGEYRGCGHRSTYLYAPQTVWTLAKAIGDGSGEGFALPPAEESGLAGEWFPGLSDPVKDAAGRRRSFACKHCWQVQNTRLASSHGWNSFVTQISGGLLTGRDVERPLELCPMQRRKKPFKRRRKVEQPGAVVVVPAALQAS